MSVPLHLIRASHLSPLIQHMRMLSMPVDSLLEQAGLSIALLSDPNKLVLESKVWRFLGAAAELQGMSHLGSWVTECSDLLLYGKFVELLLASENLYQALQLLISHVNLHNNNNDFWLEEKEECVWICHLAYSYDKLGRWQIEQHIMSFICLLIAHYAGSDWQPHKVNFQDSDGMGYEQSRFFKNSEIKFGHQHSAIAISHALLKERKLSAEVIIPPELNVIPDTFMDSLKLLLKQNYFGRDWLAENIAETLGMSVRTLKRKLHAKGSSLREVFDEIRFQQACDLIAQNMHDYESLSENLSYTHPNNFVRAFKRWSGITPREYIRLQNIELLNKNDDLALQTNEADE